MDNFEHYEYGGNEAHAIDETEDTLTKSEFNGYYNNEYLKHSDDVVFHDNNLNHKYDTLEQNYENDDLLDEIYLYDNDMNTNNQTIKNNNQQTSDEIISFSSTSSDYDINITKYDISNIFIKIEESPEDDSRQTIKNIKELDEKNQ